MVRYAYMGLQTVHWLKMGGRRVEQRAVGGRIGSKIVVEAVILLHYDDYMLNRSRRTRGRANQGRLCNQQQGRTIIRALVRIPSPHRDRGKGRRFRSFYFCTMFVEFASVWVEGGLVRSMNLTPST